MNNKGFAKSLEILIFIVIFVLVFFMVKPYVISSANKSHKNNLLRSARNYGTSAQNLWNSGGIACYYNGQLLETDSLPAGEYYIKVDNNSDLVTKIKNSVKYSGYIRIKHNTNSNAFSVSLTDGEYTINKDKIFSDLEFADIMDGSAELTIPSNNICKET